LRTTIDSAKTPTARYNFQPFLYYTFLAGTDKKENRIFLMCQEIKKGSVAKSFMMTNGLLIYG
jgi:hypothetical protein